MGSQWDGRALSDNNPWSHPKLCVLIRLAALGVSVCEWPSWLVCCSNHAVANPMRSVLMSVQAVPKRIRFLSLPPFPYSLTPPSSMLLFLSLPPSLSRSFCLSFCFDLPPSLPRFLSLSASPSLPPSSYLLSLIRRINSFHMT